VKSIFWSGTAENKRTEHKSPITETEGVQFKLLLFSMTEAPREIWIRLEYFSLSLVCIIIQ
jgi:hypothetical protein